MPDNDRPVDLDAPPRRRGRRNSRDIIRYTATEYGYTLGESSDDTWDFFVREADQSLIQVRYASGGGRIISVWIGNERANIGSGRTQAVRALAGQKVIYPRRGDGQPGSDAAQSGDVNHP
ncbi:hypothetical protein [Mycolicibacterium mucogenicum]|jgi:hypothetical protein|uniref:hypothetical protein n=1 Tax=Mycolicibacterium mucogenicum TaxID=56689 RepID=UPI00076A3838|nr:hypothetical protein [Mycolicibacterium mucogenicum]